MFGRWQQTRADRKVWAQADTLADLGGLMARWLEGELSLWPGYQPGYGPDEETEPYIGLLARLNRAGYVTDASQPGVSEPGFDGSWWEQRAAVCGLVNDDQLLAALGRVAEAYRLTILVRTVDEASRRPAVTVTRVDGRPYTAFGGYLGRRDLQHIWRGVSAPAMAEITSALQVTLVEPIYGRDDRLWAALNAALDMVPAA